MRRRRSSPVATRWAARRSRGRCRPVPSRRDDHVALAGRASSESDIPLSLRASFRLPPRGTGCQRQAKRTPRLSPRGVKNIPRRDLRVRLTASGYPRPGRPIAPARPPGNVAIFMRASRRGVRRRVPTPRRPGSCPGREEKARGSRGRIPKAWKAAPAQSAVTRRGQHNCVESGLGPRAQGDARRDVAANRDDDVRL